MRLEMGARGERLVEENFNVKKIAKQMIAVYSKYLRPEDVSVRHKFNLIIKVWF